MNKIIIGHRTTYATTNLRHMSKLFQKEDNNKINSKFSTTSKLQT